MRFQQTRLLTCSTILFIICLGLSSGCTKETISNDEGDSFNYSSSQIAPGVTLGSVYTTKNFASFTDITYFNHAWYIIFRAGTEHLRGLRGQIKIVKSNDGYNWVVQPIFINDSLDLRDPKFIIDSLNNNLYLNYTGVKYEANGSKMYAFMATFNSAAETWSEPQLITYDRTSAAQSVFWRFTFSKGKIYSAAFRSPVLGGYTLDNLGLFDNGNNYNTFNSLGRLSLGNSPNESTIRFDKEGKMYLLVRRETANVALGVSQAPDYCKVQWSNPLPVRLSSPNFLFYGDDRLLICGRDQDKLTFKFFVYNLSTKKIEKQYTFPSGVETGYAGMSFNPDNTDEVWISYYVITDKKSYINLIKLNVKTFLE